MTAVFSQEVRARAGDASRQFLEATENFVAVCREFAMKHEPVWLVEAGSNAEPFPTLFNRYVDFLHALYLHKFAAFAESLIESVNRGDYLNYALIGRAMIEHAATLRYYWEKRLVPVIHSASKRGGLTTAEERTVIDSLDQHLRGSRFDWLSFALKDYQRLKESQAARRKEKRGREPKPADLNRPDQVNVATALEHWAKEEEGVHIAYDLFCDLVHPNVGSNMLVIAHADGRLTVAPRSETAIGVDIFRQSLPLLVASAIREASRLIPTLILIRYQDDELPKGTS